MLMTVNNGFISFKADDMDASEAGRNRVPLLFLEQNHEALQAAIEPQNEDSMEEESSEDENEGSENYELSLSSQHRVITFRIYE